MPDLVDYLRDKLEHADDRPTITIMRPSGYFWMDTKGNLTPMDPDIWAAPRSQTWLIRPVSKSAQKKRWWRR